LPPTTQTQHWTKLSDGDDPGAPSPMGRDGHTACLITSQPHPLLLITGGWDKSNKAIHDAWILDVNSGTWKEVWASCHVLHDYYIYVWMHSTVLHFAPIHTLVSLHMRTYVHMLVSLQLVI